MHRLNQLNPKALLLIQFVAFWPAWRWMWWRLSSCPNEVWEILPLIAVGGILVYRSRLPKENSVGLALTTSFMLAYALAFPFVSDLVRTAIAFTAITAILSRIYFGRHIHFGLWGLMLLSLQLQNGLQFYLGYPLRVLAAKISAPMLKISGFNVTTEGTCLNWGGELILIDAPCSGIKMLWAALFLAFTLSALNNFSWVRSSLICAFSIFAVLLANVFRATALFYVEANIFDVPAWTHSGVGVLLFAITAVIVVVCADRLQKGATCASSL